MSVSREVVLRNRYGLHARPASKFVTIAHRYEAAVRLTRDGRSVNGKSIMELMLLAAEPGTRLLITADGPDEGAALDALAGLVERHFDEDAAPAGG